MAMSDHDLKILEQLEEEFYPTLAAPIGIRSSRPGIPRRTVAACAAFPVGLVLLAVGLVTGAILGTVLAVTAYAVIVGSVWVVTEVVRARRAIVPTQGAPSRPRNLW